MTESDRDGSSVFFGECDTLMTDSSKSILSLVLPGQSHAGEMER